tara:strand:+ start:1723 stop:1848 length:126 start_codon:yes stop_codon:yes gene_type:complete
MEAAFEIAFGQTPDEFYSEFGQVYKIALWFDLRDRVRDAVF